MHRSFVTELHPLLLDALTVDDVVRVVAHGAVESFASACAIDLVEPSGVLRRVALAAARARMLPSSCQWPPSRALPPIDRPTYVDPTWGIDALDGWSTPSTMAVPIRSANGIVAWVWLAAHARHPFGERELAVGAELERCLSSALSRARTIEHLMRTAQLREELGVLAEQELRLPLGAMVGWAQLLRNEPNPTSTRVQRGLEIIEQGAATMAQVLADWDTASRWLLGATAMSRTITSLDRLAQGLVAARRAHPVGLPVAITLDVVPEARVLGDEARLGEMITRMLDRIERLTPEGGAITLRITRHDAAYVIEVDGRARAIDRLSLAHGLHHSPRVADRALTVAIVRGIAELHGGTAGAERAGTTVGPRIWALIPAATPTSTDVRGDLNGIRVLLVDDADDARELAAAIVRHHGGRVVTAASSSEAMDQLRTLEIDVLVSDIAMPREDGCSFLRRARALYPGLPAVALSALVDIEDRERALAAGYATYLTKPFEPGQLVRAVRSLVVPAA